MSTSSFKVADPIQPLVKPHHSLNTVNHISLPVSNLAKAIQFYDPLLATLGFTRLKTIPDITAGYGTYKSWGFWIGQAHGDFKAIKNGENRAPGIHVCLQAPNKQAVDRFYKKALELGATDEGKPGYRQYTEGYYAAFIIDPDGWKIEVMYLDVWWINACRFIEPAFYLLLGIGLTWAYYKYGNK